jgi:hypothetical protein
MDYSLRTVANFALGGTVSVVGGGKFENGAITAAYASLLAGTPVEGQQQSKSVGESLVEYGERVLDLGTKLITLPNTAIGLVWGGVGLLFGGDIRTIADYEKYNGIVFRNSPLMSAGGAITITFSLKCSRRRRRPSKPGREVRQLGRALCSVPRCR